MTTYSPPKVVAEHVFHGIEGTAVTVIEYEADEIMIKQDRDMVYMDKQIIAAFKAFIQAKA